MKPESETIAALVPLGAASLVAFVQFAATDRWTFAVLFGVVLPLGALLDWRLAQQRSEEAGRTANHWLLLFSFALLAAGVCALAAAVRGG
jgi:hypothetical protein